MKYSGLVDPRKTGGRWQGLGLGPETARDSPGHCKVDPHVCINNQMEQLDVSLFGFRPQHEVGILDRTPQDKVL